ncbi:hypothetical protein ACFQUU_19910 [Herbaspirillum sp. GCM10030257]|uniref:hypothetical protein n=1 Tax=Herbaspirillum sp. GCM10030257 TaxID=3273393 RepID=UPI00360A98F2
MRKIPKQDAMIAADVTIIIVLTDLVIAVFAGVVFASLVFAWQHAKQIQAKAMIALNCWTRQRYGGGQ